MIRSRLRDRLGPPVRTVTMSMTPRQAEQFYDALWIVAVHHREPWTLGGRRALDELRRRLVVAAELWSATEGETP